MTTTPESWRVVCQAPGDGSGDVIVELPSELLEQLGLTLGDELSVEAGEEKRLPETQATSGGRIVVAIQTMSDCGWLRHFMSAC